MNRLYISNVDSEGGEPEVVLIGDFNIALAAEDCHPRLRTEYPHGLARSEFVEQFIPGADVVDVFRRILQSRRVRGRRVASRAGASLVTSCLSTALVHLITHIPNLSPGSALITECLKDNHPRRVQIGRRKRRKKWFKVCLQIHKVLS